MTLQTIAVNVLKGNKASEIPATIAGNPNDTAKLVFSAIRRATKIVQEATDWQIMIKRYSFSTVASQEDYALPSDIEDTKILPNTIWNPISRLALQGPLSYTDWQMLKNWVYTAGIEQYYCMYGNKLLIYPTPTSAQNINYLYFTNTPVRAVDGSPQNDWLADDDYSILSEYAIELQASWIYLKQLERPYDEEKERADNYLTRVVNQDGTRGSVGVNMQSLPPVTSNVSYLGLLIR